MTQITEQNEKISMLNEKMSKQNMSEHGHEILEYYATNPIKGRRRYYYATNPIKKIKSLF